MKNFESSYQENKNKEIFQKKLEVLNLVKNELEKSSEILSAKIYGSWLYSEKSIDLDICTIVPSQNSIVDSDVYLSLKELKERLNKGTNQDIDLVPHTEDELNDKRSTLYNPRYNPSLVDGKDIKGELKIEPIFDKENKFGFEDLAAYVLLDNRTICRRQLIRSLNPNETKIFISKILHGPGNALTYHTCKNKEKYIATPSNIKESLELFDETYKLNSKPAEIFLKECRKNFNFGKAAKLIMWYEHLVSKVLYEKEGYNDFCIKLAKENL